MAGYDGYGRGRRRDDDFPTYPGRALAIDRARPTNGPDRYLMGSGDIPVYPRTEGFRDPPRRNDYPRPARSLELPPRLHQYQHNAYDGARGYAGQNGHADPRRYEDARNGGPPRRMEPYNTGPPPITDLPPMTAPGYGYQRPLHNPRFPYWAFRILGLVHILLAILVFAIGVSLFAITVDDDVMPDVDFFFESLSTTIYIGFDGACFAIIAPLALSIGILGMLHTPSRRNLEAIRNAGMVLSTVSALLCGCLVVFESMLHEKTFRNLTPTEGEAYTKYGLWLSLIIFVALEAFTATVTGCFACITPACCVPIINDKSAHNFVYTENEPLRPLINSHNYYHDDDPHYRRY